jgi:muramoyltetrapeptide carboxypeptidase LdcA involved in peptidoglycan recycling
MVQFGRGGAMHPDTERSLRAAMFIGGEFELTPAAGWTDRDHDWNVPENLLTEPPQFAGTGWTWSGSRAVSGKLWGGCIEILDWQLSANRWMLPTSEYSGVLFGETSEEMPTSEEVYRILRNFGERGLLERFDAVLWGRPKSSSLMQEMTPAESVAYVTGQYLAVDRALAEYNPNALVVKGLDIGHTDPQQVLPYGGQIQIDPAAERITVVY